MVGAACVESGRHPLNPAAGYLRPYPNMATCPVTGSATPSLDRKDVLRTAEQASCLQWGLAWESSSWAHLPLAFEDNRSYKMTDMQIWTIPLEASQRSLCFRNNLCS